ncbi:MAG: SLATT domain-containing protein [Gammaproteobacteria bacterium]|nr:SLATT domain-containing protein [Gammaproteobacteria bacterium]
MKDILATAEEYREVVAKRAIAHEKSAEWHRKRGAQLGVSATILSAVVGTTIFATITSQMGLDGKGSITFPQGGIALLLYIVVFAPLVLAPVLTGVHAYVNDPEQAAKHKRSWAGYYRLQQRIDLLLLKYGDANAQGDEREEAIKELEAVSKEIESLCDDSITLTTRAYADADAEMQKRGSSNREA